MKIITATPPNCKEPVEFLGQQMIWYFPSVEQQKAVKYRDRR
jgi:hypothetical protein